MEHFLLYWCDSGLVLGVPQTIITHFSDLMDKSLCYMSLMNEWSLNSGYKTKKVSLTCGWSSWCLVLIQVFSSPHRHCTISSAFLTGVETETFKRILLYCQPYLDDLRTARWLIVLEWSKDHSTVVRKEWSDASIIGSRVVKMSHTAGEFLRMIQSTNVAAILERERVSPPEFLG